MLRRWTWKTGTFAVLLLLFIVANPEARIVLLLFNGLGLELVFLLILVQLRAFLPALALLAPRIRAWLCVAMYAIFRGMTRVMAMLVTPMRSMFGVATFLLVLSKNLWCPLIKFGR